MPAFERHPQVSAGTRDAATDAFWAGRWSVMASALARALRNATTGETELLAEYDRLDQQFESPPFFITESAQVSAVFDDHFGKGT